MSYFFLIVLYRKFGCENCEARGSSEFGTYSTTFCGKALAISTQIATDTGLNSRKYCKMTGIWLFYQMFHQITIRRLEVKQVTRSLESI